MAYETRVNPSAEPSPNGHAPHSPGSRGGEADGGGEDSRESPILVRLRDPLLVLLLLIATLGGVFSTINFFRGAELPALPSMIASPVASPDDAATAPQDAGAPDATAGGATEVAEEIQHVVAPGETLSRIAARYSVTVQAIAEHNEIANIDRIHVGTRLVIPVEGTAAP